MLKVELVVTINNKKILLTILIKMIITLPFGGKI